VADNFFDFKEKVTRRKRARGGDDAAAQAPAPIAAAAGAEAPLSVTQITAMIDRTLNAGLPARVTVRGEASGVKLHAASGHLYFSLKDAGACLDCIVYRREAQRLRVMPENGIEVVASGQVRVYAPRGSYQLYCETVEPVGRGAFELQFRQTLARLQGEGLLDAERKKPLPQYPLRIAIFTSRATAALRDILKVFARHPYLRVYLYHVPVQGEGAAAKITQALRDLASDWARGGRSLGIELILLARGGGSPEDLWAFNDEELARAISASPIPVITGIGHEIDVSIADMVADYHAHTPTEAAQVTIAHWRTAGDEIDIHATRLHRALLQSIESGRQQLDAVAREEFFRFPLRRIDRFRQLLDEKERALERAALRRLGLARRAADAAAQQLAERHPRRRIAVLREQMDEFAAVLARHHPSLDVAVAGQRPTESGRRLTLAMAGLLRARSAVVEASAARLRGISPESVLRRGYSITTRKRDGRMVRSVADARTGERLVTQLIDGKVESIVADPNQPGLFERS
jgi:exodeoxyribonuclease VII large subunit